VYIIQYRKYNGIRNKAITSIVKRNTLLVTKQSIQNKIKGTCTKKKHTRQNLVRKEARLSKAKCYAVSECGGILVFQCDQKISFHFCQKKKFHN
jgi:hypothetical protein